MQSTLWLAFNDYLPWENMTDSAMTLWLIFEITRNYYILSFRAEIIIFKLYSA